MTRERRAVIVVLYLNYTVEYYISQAYSDCIGMCRRTVYSICIRMPDEKLIVSNCKTFEAFEMRRMGKPCGHHVLRCLAHPRASFSAGNDSRVAVE